MNQRILMTNNHQGAIGYYRAYLPASFCTCSDYTVELTDWAADASELKEYAAVVFHRIPKAGGMDCVRRLKDNGVKVVWELDDDFWHLPRWNPSRLAFNAEDISRLDTALDLADYIWVSTEPLATVCNRWADKVRVLPNLINLADWSIEPLERTSPVKVLWAGSGFHWGDLTKLEEPLEEIMTLDTGALFYFMGDLPDAFATYQRIPGSLLGKLTSARKQVGFVEPVPFADYYKALEWLRPDIGLAPLTSELFNESKSNLKWLEYSMAGACTIASSGGAYGCINEAIDGMTFGGSAELFAALLPLIRCPELRQKLVSNARQKILNYYTWESCGAELWRKAFSELAH